MKPINLMPWREQLRAQQKRQFIMMIIISLGAALSIIVLLHLLVAFRINQQEQNNIILQQTITMLTKKTTEAAALRQQNAQWLAYIGNIHVWQRDRVRAINVIDELTRIVPDQISLTQIKRDGNVLTLVGNAPSRSPIALLMHNVDVSHWLKQPVLNEINNDDFILQLRTSA